MKVISNVFSSRLATVTSRLFKPMEIFFGCDCVSYSRITAAGNLFHITNHPDATLQYWEQALYQKNPFYQNPHGFKNGAYFLKEINMLDYQSGLQFLENQHTYLFMRFIARQESLVHHFIFGSRRENLPFTTIYMNNQHKFKAFMDFFIERTKMFDFDKYSLSLPEVMGPLYKTQATFLDAEEKAEKQKALFFKELGMTFPLSLKEIQCAQGLLQGLTAPQIAEMLHLSPRTIEARIVSIKNKLFAHNRRELIEKLIQWQTYGFL